MILIESVKARSFPGQDKVEIYEQFLKNARYLNHEAAIVEEAVYKSLIRAETFRNPRTGEIVAIGNSPDVQSLIGLQFEVFEDIKRRAEHSERAMTVLYKKIDILKRTYDQKLSRLKKMKRLRAKRHRRAMIKNIYPTKQQEYNK